MNKWQSERDRLFRLLAFIGDKGKSACRKFLEKMGFDVNKIRENLSQQIPYDAFKSLNDANEDFGHFGITVKQFFDNWATQGVSFDGGAATGATGRIYYSPKGILLSVILHETIHATHKGAGERKLYDPNNPKSDPMTGVVGCTDDENCMVIAFCDSSLFNEKDMEKIVEKLSIDFEKKKVVNVNLFDNKDLAKSYAKGTRSLGDLQYERRGWYLRTDDREFLLFFPDPSRRGKQILIKPKRKTS